MFKGTEKSRTLTFRVSEEVYKALYVMGGDTACGPYDEYNPRIGRVEHFNGASRTTPQTFAAELLEKAVIEALESRGYPKLAKIQFVPIEESREIQ